MKFDPITKSLMTKSGQLIKVLSCPKSVALKSLVLDENGRHRRCELCNHSVVDTALLNEADLTLTLRNNPRTCLIVRRNQKNIEIL